MSLLKLEVASNIATLTIQSPPANALSINLLKSIDQQLNEINQKENVKAVIIKGEGRFFSAGADIKEFTSLQNASDYKELAENGQKVFSTIENFPLPIIASIHGAALGGGLELAMACHIRIVTKTALLGLPEITLGIIPGFAGTQRLPYYVGTAKAAEMILTGEPISGEEAARLGLANHAVDDEELESFTIKLASKIAKKSKPTIKKVTELVNFAKPSRFSEGCEAEAKAFSEVFGTEDAKEGIQAFLEKRKPDFKDK